MLRAKHEKGFRVSFNLFNDANIPRIIMHTFYWGCCVWFLLKSIYCVDAQSISPVQLYATPRANPPGSSIHGVSQARILGWVAISYSRGIFPPRDRTHISCTGRWIFCYCATWEALKNIYW